MNGQMPTKALSTQISSNTDTSEIFVKKAIVTIDGAVALHRSWPGSDGLPQDIFHLSTRLSPTLNVDLLAQDENGRTLLAWRDDNFAGSGWHLPGGVVRFKETLVDRVQQVAITELRTRVRIDPTPIAHNEVFRPHDTRGHFYSVLFKCRPPPGFMPANGTLLSTDAGYLKWHKKCPHSLVPVHEMYREIINGGTDGNE